MATKAKAGESRSERARRLGPQTYDRLKAKKARTQKVQVVLDDALAEEVEELAKEVESDRKYLATVPETRQDPEIVEAAAKRERELRSLRAKLREESMELVFAAVGRKRYEELVLEHPPTEEQVEEASGKAPDFNTETFPAALVAISCQNVDLTEGEYVDKDVKPHRTRYPRAEEMWDEWNAGELTAVFVAAFQVNTQRRVVDLGEG
jgi:hypothetical protein